ncbi:hypothetical protein T492DRAFT_470578 [Pavlovales sp. CCMP2436]|nr:hypothetical protein T492DRAFT_470578 [Pavlovales sp. CCMP2436]
MRLTATHVTGQSAIDQSASARQPRPRYHVCTLFPPSTRARCSRPLRTHTLHLKSKRFRERNALRCPSARQPRREWPSRQPLRRWAWRRQSPSAPFSPASPPPPRRCSRRYSSQAPSRPPTSSTRRARPPSPPPPPPPPSPSPRPAQRSTLRACGCSPTRGNWRSTSPPWGCTGPSGRRPAA